MAMVGSHDQPLRNGGSPFKGNRNVLLQSEIMLVVPYGPYDPRGTCFSEGQSHMSTTSMEGSHSRIPNRFHRETSEAHVSKRSHTALVCAPGTWVCLKVGSPISTVSFLLVSLNKTRRTHVSGSSCWLGPDTIEPEDTEFEPFKATRLKETRASKIWAWLKISQLGLRSFGLVSI